MLDGSKLASLLLPRHFGHVLRTTKWRSPESNRSPALRRSKPFIPKLLQGTTSPAPGVSCSFHQAAAASRWLPALPRFEVARLRSHHLSQSLTGHARRQGWSKMADCHGVVSATPRLLPQCANPESNRSIRPRYALGVLPLHHWHRTARGTTRLPRYREPNDSRFAGVAVPHRPGTSRRLLFIVDHTGFEPACRPLLSVYDWQPPMEAHGPWPCGTQGGPLLLFGGQIQRPLSPGPRY